MINHTDKQFNQELDINCYTRGLKLRENTRYYCPIAATESFVYVVFFYI